MWVNRMQPVCAASHMTILILGLVDFGHEWTINNPDPMNPKHNLRYGAAADDETAAQDNTTLAE